MRTDLGLRPPIGAGTVAPPTALTIDALPYARTLVCGSYTLTGTSSGADSVAWATSPGAGSGSCTGTDTWSCVVTVVPTSAATATPTITVSATNAGGSITADTVLGFFPEDVYACYLAQNADGDYGSTLANADAIATWVDSGTAGIDLTQATGTAQPSWRSSLIGTSQPFVSCDGGDSVTGGTASNWNFLHRAGTERSVLIGAATRLTNPNANQTLATNKTNTDAARGWRLLSMDSGINDSLRQQVGNGSADVLTTNLAADTVRSTSLAGLIDVINDDEAGADDGFLYADGVSSAAAAASGALAALDGSPLTICNRAGGGGSAFTGVYTHAVFYDRVLTSGEREAADAVVAWAFGVPALPVPLPTAHYDASVVSSVAVVDGKAQTWNRSGGEFIPTVVFEAYASTGPTQGTVGARPTYTSGSHLTFDAVDDSMQSGAGVGAVTLTSAWVLAVASIDAVNTNATPAGGACGTANDGLVTDASNVLGLLFRQSGDDRFVLAFNNDGSQDCAEMAAPTDGDPHVFELQHTGGQVCVAVDGGSPTCIASGARSTPSMQWRLGRSFSFPTFIGADLNEFSAYAHVPGAATRAQIINVLKTKWGIP
jgi:hypothetical protein